MSINTSSQVRFRPDVLIQDVGEESVLLNLNTELYFTLDKVGTRMVKALQESDSVAQALHKLAAVYDVDQDQLLKDMAKLVEECQSNGLLRVIAA